MDKLKLITVIGTRPEIIKLSRIIPKLDKFFDHLLIHTGQNYDYELNQIFFKELNIRKPDNFLNAAGKNSSETIGNVIIKVDQIIDLYNPDAMLILGDTNSSMSSISAKRRKVPIFHMEAGNRCFDPLVPEEILRKIVDHTSDINLPYSDIARSYLISEGFPPDRIIKTGSPMKEVLDFYSKEISESKIIENLNLQNQRYFLISLHREENVDCEKQIENFVEILDSLSKLYKFPIIVSTHPRTKKRLEGKTNILSKSIKFLKPFGFFDYVKLQVNSFCVLSDSGTITEESSILNFPALNLRYMHERPEGNEECPVIMVGLNKKRIINSLKIITEQRKIEKYSQKIINDYDVDNVSMKVVRIIQGYTDYVNRVVWKKY